MDLNLGKRADYSIRAVLDLARHYGVGRRTAAQIAQSMQIPPTYLPALLAELVRAGLVDSTPGRGGGYELARSPERISLLEVIEKTDGPIMAQECVLRGGPCHWADACALHRPWAEAQEAFRDHLAGIALRRLVDEDEQTIRHAPAAPASRTATGP